jgi:2-polyprenyl-6-hydroxyphenyl methylase/3-demethylubiquinone-9 3-methyltransferase
MWEALANVAPLVASGGTLFIAIYNDQGLSSRLWTRVKRTYVRAPSPLRAVILGASLVRLWGPAAVRKLLGAGVGSSGQQQRAVPRGMDRWHDAKDWVGGYPFEVAKPEEIFAFYRDRGFPLSGLKTCGGGIGCNEYVFVRSD